MAILKKLSHSENRFGGYLYVQLHGVKGDRELIPNAMSSLLFDRLGRLGWELCGSDAENHIYKGQKSDV